ncbi:winged helix-turn-helix transcriptional regulator [Providencia vermicola]
MINASNYFDNLNLSQAVDKVLFCIKTKAPISTAVIAKDLAMTGEAVRQHLQKLLSLGLVEGCSALLKQVLVDRGRIGC